MMQKALVDCCQQSLKTVSSFPTGYFRELNDKASAEKRFGMGFEAFPYNFLGESFAIKLWL